MAIDERMTGILKDLEPEVEKQLDRHLATAEPWHPHELIQWSDGKDFARLGGEEWDPSQTRVREVAQKALILNLLTEDNLPSYFFELATAFGRDGAWGSWVGQWTAEENRHATAMRDFLVTSRAADPVALEEARMPHMKAGYKTNAKTPLDVTAYVAFQELATAVSHGNTGRILGEDGYKVGNDLMTRIAADERLHYLFYLNMGTAAFELEPDLMMRSVAQEVMGFEMPGADTIPNFKQDAKAIAEAGIYSVPLHVGRVLKPIFRHWDVLNRQDVTGDGKVAQDELGQYFEAAEAFATKKAADYEELAAKKAAEQA